MRLSTNSEYGLMAVGYIASHAEDGHIVSDVIAEEYGIPAEYLYKTLNSLAKVGILESRRGPRGGFIMGKKPDQITLLEIFEAIDGPYIPQHNIAEQTKHERFGVNIERVCNKALAEGNKVLKGVTLADLIHGSKKPKINKG
ncbi:MAG: hypothetical protein A2Y12_09705 [Planctomycetes bacterium GWF2_42_9]|nr:MAG: hypothetical protein A2Y12_09705 [Planctomycetes bacterium GWF2_42_9]